MIPTLKITKCKCVKTPERAYQHDAGIDFFVPNFEKPIALFPHQRKMIPSGIHAKIPHGYMLKAEDKSGVGIKKGLKYIGGVIDENYQGEINICLFNTSDEKVMVHAGEKIIQFILIPVLYSGVELVSSLKELFPEKTERGSNGFGSSSNKEEYEKIKREWENKCNHDNLIKCHNCQTIFDKRTMCPKCFS